MHKKSHVLILTTAIILCWHLSGWAWNADRTHNDMSDSAAENSVLSSAHGDYLKSLGFNKNTEEEFKLGNESRTVKKWIGKGAVDEDSGSPLNGRFYNHFHDPTKAWSSAGLTSNWFWVKGGKSAVLWSLNYSENDSAWQWVRSDYYNALISKTNVDRQAYFAKTFKGLGQMIHLIQDMAQPAHVRNDPHPADDSGYVPGFEYWAKKHPIDVKNMASTPIFPTVDTKTSNNGYIPITQFFDTDQYDGTNPSANLSQGLSEYTNANFFSEDTIINSTFPYPKIYADMTIDIRSFTNSWTGNTYPRMYYSKKREGETNNGQGYLLSTVDFLHDWRVKEIPLPTVQTDIPVLDENVYKDYASLLIPRAVGYSAGLLNYFFRGEMDATGVETSDSSGISGIDVTIKNTTPNEDMSNGTFFISYRYKSPGSTEYTYGLSNGISSGTLPFNTEAPEYSFTFSQPIPNDATGKQYILVFHGTLGNEEGAVVGKVVNHGIFEDWEKGFTGRHLWGWDSGYGTYGMYNNVFSIVDGFEDNPSKVLKINFSYGGIGTAAQLPKPVKLSFDYYVKSLYNNFSIWLLSDNHNGSASGCLVYMNDWTGKYCYYGGCYYPFETGKWVHVETAANWNCSIPDIDAVKITTSDTRSSETEIYIDNIRIE